MPDALRDLLQIEGASVHVSTSGSDGVKAANGHAFDVIICDIRMPDMDGYAVAKALARSPHNGRTPMIAYTGFGGPEDRKRAEEAGFRAHIAKPVTLDLLVETIEHARS
jgi:two-component system CheB/CheR fusion protein